MVLSNKFIDDYDRVTDSTLSHAAAIKKKYFGDRTGLSVATASRLHYDVVGTQLTQRLGTLLYFQWSATLVLYTYRLISTFSLHEYLLTRDNFR